MAEVDYTQALDGISGKLDVLHDDAGDIVDAINQLAQVDNTVDLSTLDNVSQLLAYTDLLLVVVNVALFLIGGLIVGFIVTQRLR